ncbi:MAG: HlyD family efflux transporter periplasmic adaptor subunit [Bacteroidetes bacterium]|nr:HlyD family efflux transporter periplasmic adaptor subunit [Bacteroidota bacterium]
MKKIHLAAVLISICLTCCIQRPKEEEVKITARPHVQVEGIRTGSINDDITLSATSVYLKRNVVTAEIPAFITKVNFRLGDKVVKGQVLYELQTKEKKALGRQLTELDTSLKNFGTIKIYAPGSGIVSTFDKQQTGDYVLEGTQLCTIAESSELAFQINVPYEYNQFTKAGSKCTITLPDNSVHQAVITTPLSAMNALAQTQTMLAKCNETLFLPENLIAKVQVTKTGSTTKQIISKACVLSDEMMQEFWVMKLINDTTAVKVPVTIGNRNETEIEINAPVFSLQDRIISNGNYGLPDTAYVKIIK